MKALYQGKFIEVEDLPPALEAMPHGFFTGKAPNGEDYKVPVNGKLATVVSDVRFEDQRYLKLEPEATTKAA